MNYSKRLYYLLAIITVIVLLIVAQSLLIPFVLAIIVWFVIRILKKGLQRIPWVKKWPEWIATVLSTILLISIGGLAVTLISKNIQQLSESMPAYQENIEVVSKSINETLDIDIVSSITDMLEDFNYGSALGSLFTALTSIFSDFFLVLLYLLFILIEEPIFPKKIKNMYKDQEKRNDVQEILGKIDKSTSSYMAIKSFTSLLTGTFSFIALLAIGVDAPFFWAFLIFLLNYIPTIGSLIATLFPTVFAMLQFGDLSHPLLVLSIVGAIQIIVGNFIEPRIMGDRLNISILVVFLTLAIWGAIWGVIGMLLSVPITVIIIIILSEIPSTQGIAILLSKNGEVRK